MSSLLSAFRAHLPPELRRLAFEYADDTLAQLVNASEDYLYHKILYSLEWIQVHKCGDKEENLEESWRRYKELHPNHYCGIRCAYESAMHGQHKGCTKPHCTRYVCMYDCPVCGETRFVHKPSRS
jgi:hypothetical protein